METNPTEGKVYGRGGVCLHLITKCPCNLFAILLPVLPEIIFSACGGMIGIKMHR